jgi:hypothetical protein
LRARTIKYSAPFGESRFTMPPACVSALIDVELSLLRAGFGAVMATSVARNIDRQRTLAARSAFAHIF